MSGALSGDWTVLSADVVPSSCGECDNLKVYTFSLIDNLKPFFCVSITEQ